MCGLGMLCAVLEVEGQQINQKTFTIEITSLTGNPTWILHQMFGKEGGGPNK